MIHHVNDSIAGPKMNLGNCEVCNERPAIGVASTSMPLSVAFCRECAAQGADPEIVFLCMYDDCRTDFNKMADGVADGMTTWKGGRFVTYREWATERAGISAGKGAET